MGAGGGNSAVTRVKAGWRDTVTGALVLVTAVVLFALVYGMKGHGGRDGGYDLTARFNRADGIGVGSVVRLSGIPVGSVVAQDLGPDFRAVLTLRIDPGIKLSTDTAAVIHTDGLLGAKFIELQPGAEDEMLAPGDEVEYTQDAVVIEELLDMIIQQGRAKRGINNAARP